MPPATPPSVKTSFPPPPVATAPPPPTTPVVEDIDQVVFFNTEDGYGLFSETRGPTCSLAAAATNDAGRSFAPPVRLASFACANGSPASSLAFDHAGDGFVYGPRLFVTHDGGATWAAQSGFAGVISVIALGRSVWLLERSCPQASDGCTLHLERSNDGGRTWSPAALPHATTDGTPAMLTTSASAAVIVVPPVPPASPDTVPTSSPTLITTDGGTTWRRGSAPCVGLSTFLSRAPDGTVWLACASEPGAGNQAKALAQSSDGGITWALVHCPARASAIPAAFPGCYFSDTMNGGYLGDLVATSSTTAFIAGGRNDVLVTRDGGRTWSRTNPPIGDMDSGTGPLFFTDPANGWVVSGATSSAPQGLWRTSDGGNTWSEIWSAPATTASSAGNQTHCPPSRLHPPPGPTAVAVTRFPPPSPH